MVGRVLQQRGYRVIETDFEDRLSVCVDRVSGEKVEELPTQPYSRAWLHAHVWCWDRERMGELLKGVGCSPVFFCGGSDNDSEFRDAFLMRFGLSVDGETLKRRLQPREPERWVDGSVELERQIERNGRFVDECAATGRLVIDSSVAPESVADAIMAHVLGRTLPGL